MHSTDLRFWAKLRAQVSGSFASSFAERLIAFIALSGILLHLSLRYLFRVSPSAAQAPLLAALLFGGVPLVYELIVKAFRKEFGSDLLAGMSIVTSALLGEYLAGSVVVLMLSGGKVLESYAVRSASSVLEALAKRMPSVAHARREGATVDVPVEQIRVGDLLVVFPHEICPADGSVIEGHGEMDESYLTGEPFEISKTPGSHVLSGALNGETLLTIRCEKLPVDSRYASIMKVMHEAQQKRPALRRLGDQLGAMFTPIAVAVALAAWVFTGNATRFLAVLVIATPCPLLLAIPVSIIGAVSLSAKRGIVVRDPSVLEQLDACRTIIFDKTGTLTYGLPQLTEEILAPGLDREEVLRLVASVEKYSRHPLARAILHAARAARLSLTEAADISEPPGEGLRGTVEGRSVRVTSRARLLEETGTPESSFPPAGAGLECVVALDGRYAATYRFRDTPRQESKPFIAHLGAKHQFERIMLVSGDRESEARYLADLVGVQTVHSSSSPEEKVAIVRAEVEKARTIFVGDGINDAPALVAATVGIALGPNSDVTTEAASAVIMDASLGRVDELFHIGRRMRAVALQCALGGMALSLVGMGFAAFGLMTPVAGAVAQEIIDVLAVLNALRAALPPKTLIDF